MTTLACFDWDTGQHPRDEHGRFITDPGALASLEGKAVNWTSKPSKEAALEHAGSKEFQDNLPPKWRGLPTYVLPPEQAPNRGMVGWSSAHAPGTHIIGVVIPKAEDEEKARELWRQDIQKAKDMVSNKVNQLGMSDDKKKSYTDAAHLVIDYMNHKMVQHFLENVKGIQFYNNVQEITDYHGGLTGSKHSENEKVGGIWVWNARTEGNKGVLHLDGGGDTGENFGASIRHIYAHEMSHAIDGHRSYSDSQGWQAAWQDEIKQPHSPLSEYAATSHVEGWAEFGRLMLTNPREAKTFPKCYQYWKENGLTA